MNPAAVLSVLVQARGIEETNRRLRDIDKTSQRTAASTDKLERKFSNLDNTVGDFNRSMTAAGNVVKLVKFPAMIAGAGMAAQALGSLAAAGVAAGAALAPLAGASAGVAGGYLAMGQAAGVAKLAFAGLEDAIQGDKDALKKLTPTQREFVKQIQASAAEARGLRGVAQRGLLPGLTDALKSINPLFDRLRPIVGGTATVMGQLARQAGGLAGSDGVLDKISRLGRTNVAVIGHFGTGAIALGHALITVLDAARPLTLWFSNLAEKAGLWINGQTNILAKSGALVGFFEQTRLVMSRIGRIAADVAVGLFNIAKAGKPLGDELLVKVVRLAEAFKDWTQSASGKNQIAEYFRNARGPILEITGLIGDIGGAILRLSRPTAGTGGLIAMFRPLVPILESVVKSTTAAFGPVFVGALANVLKVVAALAGTSGPLTLLVQAIGATAGAFARLLNTVPGLSTAVVTILGLVSVTKILTAVFGPLVAVTKALQVALIGEAAAANAAGIANLRMRASLVLTAVAMYAQAAATKIATAAQWLWNAAMTANPIGLVVVGLAALVGAVVLAYKKSETFRNIVNAAWTAIKNTTMAVLNWLAPAVKVAWSAVSEAVVVAVKVVKAYVTVYATAAKAIVTAILAAFDFLKGLAGKVTGFLAAAARRIGDTIKDFVTPALNIGKAIGTAIVDGMGNLGHLILDKVKDALDFVGDNLPGPLGTAAKIGTSIAGKIGDGAGKAAQVALPSGAGLAGGSLMGAKSIMAPFASIAGRFGLRTSSGLRPGAITSSGNPSYHGTGNAIDEAGTPAGMLGYFRYLKSNFGSRLRELIYTPGGVGIKDGKPFRYTGQVAADHFDHVHVAFTGGAGDGIGRAARTGDGPGRIFNWGKSHGFTDEQSAGWVGNIAQESNFVASAQQRNGPGRGLAQWGGSRFTALQEFAAKRKKPWTDFNTQLDFMWHELQGSERGAYLAIKGTKSLEAATSAIATKYERAGKVGDRLGPARAALKRFAKGGSGSGKGSKGAAAVPKGTAISDAARNAPESTTYSDQAAVDPLGNSVLARTQDFLNQRAPVKGMGPTKGFPSGYTPPTPNELPSGPTWEDYVMSGIARAKLTSGTDDDIAALTTLVGLRESQMNAALSDSDPRNDADAIDAYLAAKDALKELTDATKSEMEAMKEHTAALKGVQDELKRQTDFATSVTNTSNFQLTKTLADIIGGQIVGYGVAGRKFTPGTGVEYSY